MGVMSMVTGLAELRASDLDRAGGKGANLGELLAGGFDVPPGFVVTTDAYRRFVTDAGIGDQIVRAAADWAPADVEALAARLIADADWPEGLADAVTASYDGLGESVPVAVRSSATAEDLGGASFAGQQETYLNVRGREAVLDAVRRCWASGWGARAVEYRRRAGFAPADVAVAVVVQTMVEAEASGVMFTANPDNGRVEQTALNAAWGLGESVVSGTVTPDTLVVEPASGRVVQRVTADKAVWTRPRAQGTVTEAVPEERRREPVLTDAEAVELARLGERIEAHFDAPQDVEWARAGGRFVVLQSRPITALPPRVGDVPTDWPIEDPTGMYVRASIIEQMPDPLSPLFADLVPDAVVRSLGALFDELAGVRLPDVAFPLINGYPYYYYSRATFLRLLAQTPGFLGRVLGPRSSLQPVNRWRETSLPAYRDVVARWDGRDLRPLSDAALVAGLQELLHAGCVYYTAVQAVIPFTSMNDVLFAAAYTRLARRPGDPEPAAFVVGFDAQPIRADKGAYDLARWASGQPGLPDALRAGAPAGPDPSLASAWRTRLEAYLREFGHTTANLDFMAPVPADDPTPVLDAVRFYLDSDADPHARQRALAQTRERVTRELLARLDPVRRALIGALLRRAQRDAPVREEALADQGLAWPAMRRICAELGRRLVAAGTIAEASDVYWLRAAELSEAELSEASDLRAIVEERKATWRGQRRATPPQILPEAQWLRWFGSMMPARTDAVDGGPLRGTASSGGRATATARVVMGPEDFASLDAGEVLVAPITTPAFTPLFARASGVVTDIGGPLSHSSIVAREYGIPAVLGTAVATRRIRSGDRITVDGERGEVTIGEQTIGEPTIGEQTDAGGAASERAASEAAASRRTVTPGRLALGGAGLAATAALGALAVRMRAGRRPRG